MINGSIISKAVLRVARREAEMVDLALCRIALVREYKTTADLAAHCIHQHEEDAGGFHHRHTLLVDGVEAWSGAWTLDPDRMVLTWREEWAVGWDVVPAPLPPIHGTVAR